MEIKVVGGNMLDSHRKQLEEYLKRELATNTHAATLTLYSLKDLPVVARRIAGRIIRERYYETGIPH